MTRRRLLVPLAVLPLAASTLSAAADPGSPDDGGACREAEGAFLDEEEQPLEVCRQQVWFHATEPVGNLAGAGLAATPGWGEDPPDGSWADGSGGGYAGSSQTRAFLEDDPIGTATFEGGFAGPIENLAVEMYMIAPGGHLDLGHALHQEHRFRTTLEIDGETLVRADAVSTVPHEVEPAGLVFRFMFVDVLAAMDRRSLDLGEDAEHSVRLRLAPWREGIDEAVYTYGSVEAPSRMIFNAERHETLQYVWVEAD